MRYGGCWTHLRRRFRDTLKEAAEAMALFMKDIVEFNSIEARGREAGLDPTALVDLRRGESIPIVVGLMCRTSSWKDDYSLAGKVAEAMKYARKQRHALFEFLRDGRVSIDNNVCERAIRPLAIGRNNWQFAASVSGAETAATHYTLVKSAKASGVVDPRAPLSVADPAIQAALDVAAGVDAGAAAAIEAALASGHPGLTNTDFGSPTTNAGGHDHDTITVDTSQSPEAIACGLLHEWEHWQHAEEGGGLNGKDGDARSTDPCWGCIHAQMQADSSNLLLSLICDDMGPHPNSTTLDCFLAEMWAQLACGNANECAANDQCSSGAGVPAQIQAQLAVFHEPCFACHYIPTENSCGS